MPEPIIVAGGQVKLASAQADSPAAAAPSASPGFGGRILGLAALLFRGMITLAMKIIRLLLKALSAGIARYPRHALAAALSLVMLAAIAYTQNRDGPKPPLNQVKVSDPEDPKKDQSVAQHDKPVVPANSGSAAADPSVGAVSHTATTEPALPAPTAADESVAHAPKPDAPIEPAPTAPEPTPSIILAAAEPPPTAPDSKHTTTETPALPPPITPAQPLPTGDLAPLPPVATDPIALAQAPTSDQKPDDGKSPMFDLPPAAPIEANPNPQPLPISSNGEPGPLFPAAEKKPEDLKKPEIPEPSKVAASPAPPSDPPKAEPKPDVAKSDPTKAQSKPETKGLEPPAPVAALPEPPKVPLPDPKPVVAEQKPQPPPVIEKPAPPAPEALAHPEPAITAQPPEEPRPAQPSMPPAAVAANPRSGGVSDPALAGWKEIPNLGKVPLELGEDRDSAAEPGEQTAGVAAAGARDPRSHVARDVSFELEASGARQTAPAGSKTHEPPSLARSAEKIEATLHVVERKENFWTISRLYYGSGRYYKALWKANAEKSPRIDGLRVGDVIVIPAPEDLDSSLFERLTSNVRKTAAQSQDAPNPTPRQPRPHADELVLPPARGTPVSRRDRTFEEREDPALTADDDQATTHSAARTRDSSANPDRPRRTVYKVRATDTLRSIARDTLGTSRRAGEIMDLNPGLVDESGRLTAGQLIELPDDARVSLRR